MFCINIVTCYFSCVRSHIYLHAHIDCRSVFADCYDDNACTFGPYSRESGGIRSAGAITGSITLFMDHSVICNFNNCHA